MTYAEILAAVTSLTNSAHLPNELAVAVQAATLRLHHSDFYERDIAEQLVNIGTSAFTFSFDAKATFARYRAIKYLRKYDNVTAVLGKRLEKLEPDNLFNNYGVEKTDVFYAAGNNLVVRSSSSLQYIQSGWYQSPVVTPDVNYSSWIADTVPHAIIFDACSLMFKMLSMDEQSHKFDGLVAEQLLMVKMHGIDSEGR